MTEGMAMPPAREPRRQTFIKAKMRISDEWFDIGIANVSATGLLVKCPTPPAVGTRVEIARRGTRIVGEVMWSRRTRFGLRSDEEIDQSALIEAGLQPLTSDLSPPPTTSWWHWRRSR
jgi:hypothetical protein